MSVRAAALLVTWLCASVLSWAGGQLALEWAGGGDAAASIGRTAVLSLWLAQALILAGVVPLLGRPEPPPEVRGAAVLIALGPLPLLCLAGLMGAGSWWSLVRGQAFLLAVALVAAPAARGAALMSRRWPAAGALPGVTLAVLGGLLIWRARLSWLNWTGL